MPFTHRSRGSNPLAGTTGPKRKKRKPATLPASALHHPGTLGRCLSRIRDLTITAGTLLDTGRLGSGPAVTGYRIPVGDGLTSARAQSDPPTTEPPATLGVFGGQQIHVATRCA